MAWLERLWLVDQLKTSFYIYPLVNALHIASIGALVTSVLLMDLRILGAFSWAAPGPFVTVMREVASAAFTGAVLTGLPMFAIRAQQYATNTAFLIKMCLLALAGLNLLAFHLLSRNADPGDAAGSETARAFCVVSIVLWPSILVAGRFVGFI